MTKPSIPKREKVGFKKARPSLFFVCFVVWAVTNIPVIIFSRCFPLDFPAIYQFGNNLPLFLPQSLSPYNGSGRYFPIYWAFNEIQVAIFSGNITALFAVQSAVILIACTAFFILVLRITGDLFYSALFFILFYLASPLAENISTIGKGEPLMVMFLSIILLIFWNGCNKRTIGMLGWLACAALMTLAMWTKETSLIILGFSMSGLAVTLVFAIRHRQFQWRSAAWRSYAELSAALVAGLALSRLPFLLFENNRGESSYTTYDLTLEIFIGNVEFYIQQQPDILLFFFISAASILIYITSSLRSGRDLVDIFDARIVFVVSLLAAAVAYVAAILVWRWPMAYYLLFPSALFRFCAVVGLYLVISIGLKKARRVFVALICFVTILMVPYVYYIIRSQISYSLVYSEALENYALSRETRDTTLVIESYPFFAEQISGSETLLGELYGEPMKVRGIYDILDPQGLNSDFLQLLNISDQDVQRNIENLPKTGDYVLAFTGAKLATWFLRGVTPYFNADSMLKTSSMYDMELVAESEIKFPAAYVHVWTGWPTFDTTSLGYKLYRVLEDQPKFLWSGRYPDGWVGAEATLTINSSFTGPVDVKFSVPDFALPNRLQILQDGVEVDILTIDDTNERTVRFERETTESTKLEFKLDRAVAPIDIGLAQDKRPLAARIGLVGP